jgi:phosphoribosylcarboxyaminoimidazole (NCAIR) mutase
MNKIPSVNPSGGRGWLDEWMSFAKNRASMTDEIMLEAVGLAVMSAVVARRSVLKMDFADIYPNLYVMLVAHTTYYHKSTALALAKTAIEKVAPHLLIPALMTPEMLMSKMSGLLPTNIETLAVNNPQTAEIQRRGVTFAGQKIQIADEASKIFGKDYMGGTEEFYLEAYDNPPTMQREFKRDGLTVIRNPSLTLLFATTPANLGVIFGERDTGFYARFAMVTPENDRIQRVHNRRGTDKTVASPQKMLDGLTALYGSLPMPNQYGLQTLEIGISDEALEMYNAYADALHAMCAPDAWLDDRLRGTYGRLGVQALKIAMLMCVARGDKVINTDDWAHAQIIAERWRASAHRARTAMVNSVDNQIERDIIHYLRGSKSARTLVDIARMVSGDRRTIERILSNLVDGGVLSKDDEGGKKVFELRYRVIARTIYPYSDSNRASYLWNLSEDLRRDVERELARMDAEDDDNGQ